MKKVEAPGSGADILKTGTGISADERISVIIIAFFTACVIMIVRMYSYERPMDQFFWSSGNCELADFFSFYKMVAIVICGILALFIILKRVLTGTLIINKSYAYIPMSAYVFFVILSYIFSDYKYFALYGYNDRFEGTLALLCYMIMLFFIINSVCSERNVKCIIYPLAATSALLGLLGLSQAFDHDFFRTTIGKKLITPGYYWEHIDNLNFTFQNRQIYQTVYNINYVSFYLTLLIPLFGMLFIREKRPVGKAALGALFTLLFYNLIGSESSGGFLGMAAAVILAVIVLNKRILDWKRSVLILLALTIAVSIATYDRWYPELSGDAKEVLGMNKSATEPSDPDTDQEPGSVKPHIDYIITEKDYIAMSLNGEPLILYVSDNENGKMKNITLIDAGSKAVPVKQNEEDGTYIIEDERFREYATVAFASGDDQYCILVNTAGMLWTFSVTDEGIVYSNQLGNDVRLTDIPSFGWKNNQGFGSGRGYIWSRTIPMMRDTIFIGHGADTYCIYFPHQDYAGKYSADWNINKIVDKPHNMYMGMAIGTGLLSMLALMTLWGIYIVQSIKLYFRARYDDFDFNTFAGAGIFLGICAFLAAGLVNDSSVSVMPMFYGLLGTGISINGILKKSNNMQ